MINRLQETTQQTAIQDTTFATDVVGRFVCSTWDEATNNGGVQFDAIVIGAGMFGAYCAEKIYRSGNLRVLVLEAGPFLVSEHVQNLSRIGLNAAGAVAVPNNNSDPGTRALVWGVPWRSPVPFPGLAYCIGGRSLYWGGWSPRLTAADLAKWPAEIAALLQTPPGSPDEYETTERETGVFDKTDYISGPLNDDLKARPVQFRQVFERTDSDRCDPPGHGQPGLAPATLPRSACARHQADGRKRRDNTTRGLGRWAAEVHDDFAHLRRRPGVGDHRINAPRAGIVSDCADGPKPDGAPAE